MLRYTLIFPLLVEPAAINRGLTVNYIEKTDCYRATNEDIRNELKKMKAEGLAMSISGGSWKLTDEGVAHWIGEKSKATQQEKPGGKVTSPLVAKVANADTIFFEQPPANLEDFTELLAKLGQLQDVNQLKTKIELICQLHKWLNPDIGDLFAEIIDELELHQNIATMAQKCLKQVVRS